MDDQGRRLRNHRREEISNIAPIGRRANKGETGGTGQRNETRKGGGKGKGGA